MLFSKSYPRCKGDMHEREDMYGPYRECLQCGYMMDKEKSHHYFSALQQEIIHAPQQRRQATLSHKPTPAQRNLGRGIKRFGCKARRPQWRGKVVTYCLANDCPLLRITWKAEANTLTPVPASSS